MAKHAGGRPSKYNAEILVKTEEFYQEQLADPEAIVHVTALARKLGLNKDTVMDWAIESNKGYKQEFSVLYKKIRDLMEERYVELNLGRIKGYSPGAMFALKNHFGWTDRQDIKHESDQPIVFNVDMQGTYKPRLGGVLGEKDTVNEVIPEGLKDDSKLSNWN